MEINIFEIYYIIYLKYLINFLVIFCIKYIVYNINNEVCIVIFFLENKFYM